MIKYSILSLLFICTIYASTGMERYVAEGVIVAILRVEKDTRITVPPGSLADLAEYYMVRIDRWSPLQKDKYILVEFSHQGRNIPYGQFDKFIWRIILPEFQENDRHCFVWSAKGVVFKPTAFGINGKLPDPKNLKCFSIKNRPVKIGRIKNPESFAN